MKIKVKAKLSIGQAKVKVGNKRVLLSLVKTDSEESPIVEEAPFAIRVVSRYWWGGFIDWFDKPLGTTDEEEARYTVVAYAVKLANDLAKDEEDSHASSTDASTK